MSREGKNHKEGKCKFGRGAVYRDWTAVSAWFRNGAGQMGDKRKKQSREECRKWKQKKDEGF